MCSNNIKRPIISSKAPAAIGPYSHAYMAGDFLYVSGQLPMDPAEGKLIDGDIEAMTHRALTNLGLVLSSAALDYTHVIKTTVFITDMSLFPRINAVYADFFPSNPPARSCVQVAGLPAGALIEIEAVAYDDHSHYAFGEHTHEHAHGGQSHSHEHDHSHTANHVHTHE